jgi:hypothetical protein
MSLLKPGGSDSEAEVADSEEAWSRRERRGRREKEERRMRNRRLLLDEGLEGWEREAWASP